MYGWFPMGRRCETEASIPLDAIRRPRDTPIWKLEGARPALWPVGSKFRKHAPAIDDP